MMLLAVAVMLSSLLLSCAPAGSQPAVAGGNINSGRRLVVAYGCGTCHQVASIGSAIGRVGPPLTGVGGRAYISGKLSNTPPNLVRWIRAPREVDPTTAMPNLNVSEQDARDIAEFLYTLR